MTAEKQNVLLEDFRGARREQRKLSAALNIFLALDSFSPEEAQPILDYLVFRKRSACEELIRTGNLRGLRAMGERGWIEEKDLPGFRALATELSELELWAYLYRYDPAASRAEADTKHGDTPSAGRPLSKTELSEKAFQQLFRKLLSQLPGFGPVLETMKISADPEISYLSSDGFTIYYHTDRFLASYLEDSGRTARHLLHLFLHSTFFHPLLMNGHEERLWNLACDIFVELTLDHWDIKDLNKQCAEQRDVLLHERKLGRSFTSAEELYQALKRAAFSEKQLAELERTFTVDSHEAWKFYRNTLSNRAAEDYCGGEGEKGEGPGRASIEQLQQARSFAKKWATMQKDLGINANARGLRRGTNAGTETETLSLIRKHKTSYRDFLSDFMVCQEEIELDLDSFDYLPYWYSREHYDGMVLLEPLEYREMYKLDEMVIAIDTSGSCRGEIVKLFLEETWNILTEKGNFFRNMNVHIIQCDSMIQSHAVIRSREEFEAYMENPKVQGFGGTDFRPVFDLVDELIRKKELQNLKGLLYFTDGDGVYPTAPPQYETAFIFLNPQTERQSPPSWALRLNLGLSFHSDDDEDYA